MTTARATSGLDSVNELLARFDPGDMDVPGGRARIRIAAGAAGTADALIEGGIARPVPVGGEPDAELTAAPSDWGDISRDVRAGMAAYEAGRLRIRRNLHLGVGFLAATSGDTDPKRLRFERVRTTNHDLAVLSAGEGTPLVCIHGLGGTKASFLPTVSALAPGGFRVICVDLPGFGDSHKPGSGRYDAPWFAKAVIQLLDELGIERAHLAGNSMGGRISIEAGLRHPDRVDRLVLLSPALAWLRDRGWKWLLRMPLPQLGYLQPTPRRLVEPVVRRIVPGANDGWAAAGVDEFLRSYLTPAGRYAFYESARNIYMDEPHGEDGLWSRLTKLAPETMFVWGRQDQLVPISFMKHVEKTLPAARHLELECGHVPQVELPGPTHRAMAKFLRA
ncbi:MAG: alpha/beta fold hydrolase [Actinomycetota bacterium]|nr:alpha/beta fold hydrolase [Actinomycetota bacterium]